MPRLGAGRLMYRIRDGFLYNPAMPNKLSTLIAALSSSDPASRAEAAEQLAQHGPGARLAAVALVIASGDEDESVRQWATNALEGMGPPEAADVPQLVSLVEARSSDVGYWATTLLGRLKAEAASAVEALARVIGGNGDLAVRQRAAWALGEIGPAARSALPTLQKASEDSDPRLSRLAQAAISQITGQ